MNLNRRDLLACGTALAASTLAGCTGPGSSELGSSGFGNGEAAVGRMPSATVEMDAVTDAEIATRVIPDPSLEWPKEEQELIAEAVAGESPRAEGTEPPLPEYGAFVHEGAVYELSHAVVDSEPATTFFITLDPADGEVDDDEAIAYADLPAVDRETFEERGWDDIEFLGFGTSLLYLDDEVGESALVPEPEYSVIVWDEETRGRFAVDGSHDAPLETYEYDAARISESTESFGADVRERCEFALEGLSSDEEEVVSRAIDGKEGYVVPHDESVPEAVEELAERFHEGEDVHSAVDELTGEGSDENGKSEEGGKSEEDGESEEKRSVSGEYLVRYKERTYWTGLYVAEG
ncbi:hypothetical protein [Halegenticoccus tardaugens]|uniref:hypothetical protein n=1 Tax=Halegenticoccus tardaugens TaxID=2071624 RepID=UPI00100BB79A|nr:hypothetical protein [Halegenticoccus tardaugens]